MTYSYIYVKQYFYIPISKAWEDLDAAAGVWCEKKSVVTTPRTGRYSADAAGGDASVELTRRCRHAAAVGDLMRRLTGWYE